MIHATDFSISNKIIWPWKYVLYLCGPFARHIIRKNSQRLFKSRDHIDMFVHYYYCYFVCSGAAIFDMEYARWLEDDQRHISELRSGLNQHYSDGDLRIIVDAYISHYDEIFRLKGVAAKSDVFHLITGMWTTSAERCFLWMGGFRPSELIKVWVLQVYHLSYVPLHE